ncbi:hypothetical protein DN069_35570 [Streptacidiphilus pinicola]|uniref:Uncharacterized protein n=1 Tax=Streptacidiphilus pinicola TaxID=2219663 RepID=A0A2X0ITL5_9ACTN|nr:hypothetical protein [Streptacidiphilus pinicola]RAG80916.1 hypothetical protein DN069_35570 [Streptacidiphilus pinicola]
MTAHATLARLRACVAGLARFVGLLSCWGFALVSAGRVYLFVVQRTVRGFREPRGLPGAGAGLLAPFGGPAAPFEGSSGAGSGTGCRPLRSFGLPGRWWWRRVLPAGGSAAARRGTPGLVSEAGIAVRGALVPACHREVPAAPVALWVRHQARCWLVVDGVVEIGRPQLEQVPPRARTVVAGRARARWVGPV